MSDSKPAQLQGRRIMVVEDEYLVALYLTQSLEDLGATIVGPSNSVSDALALLSTEAPDMAVLDINLGRERVYPVAQALRERGIPFVFTTGYDNWVIPQEYADQPRIEKPIDPAALVRLLIH